LAKEKVYWIVIVAIGLFLLVLFKDQTSRSVLVNDVAGIGFDYSYMFNQNANHEIVSSPDFNLGQYAFVFHSPDNTCSGTERIDFSATLPRSTDHCWTKTDTFNGVDYNFDSAEQTVSVEDWMSVTYKPQKFLYRPEGYVDNSYVIYELRFSGSILGVEAENPEKVTLNTPFTLPINVANNFCGGDGILTIKDNAVLLNQWVTDVSIPVSYTDCISNFAITLPVDKLGKHDVSLSASFKLPDGSYLESDVNKFSYEVVREQIVQDVITFDSSNQVQINNQVYTDVSDQVAETNNAGITISLLLGAIVLVGAGLFYFKRRK
jgi:LPXTG-motif cell wall-anchored protein